MEKQKQAKTYKHPKLRKAFIIIGIVLGAIFGTLFLAWAGINTFKFAVYKDFYSMTTKAAKIPGLKDGAVPQGMTCYKDDSYIMCMYMKDNTSASRIYLQDKDGNSRYVEMYEDAEFKEPCTRHCGGVQYVDAIDKLYVSDAAQYVFELDLNKLLDKNTTKIQINTPVHLDNEASSIFSDDNYVYVSEFNKANTEWTTKPEHKLSYEGEVHQAYINAFVIDKVNKTVNFEAQPVVTYSVPDLIQGIAFRDNVLYMTTSWGISNSHLYMYDTTKFPDVGDKKFVTSSSLIKDVKCPPMLEDLDFNSEGKLITYNESASKKYIFGKFFFADKIYAIKVN